MNNIMITPSKLNGSVNIPPSKSLCHRAIICASLANGVSTIENVGYSEDIDATIEAMCTLGAIIKKEGSKLIIDGSAALKSDKSITIDCCESGSTLRFLIPIALHNKTSVTFTGKGRLPERPLNSYYNIFEKTKISYETQSGFLPLTVNSGDISGVIEIEGNVSSQFVSGLLFSLPLYPFDSEIKITTPFESKGYVDMTIDTLQKFGITVTNNNYNSFRIHGNQQYKPADYVVEGDFSQAAFFLAAGALGSFVVCKGLNLNSMQGDKNIIDVIEKMGGKIVCENNGIAAVPTQLHGCEIDVAQIPDLVPIITVLASLAKGETRIKNAARLRIKESDRLSAITQQLNTLGATVIERNDGLIIEGASTLTGGKTESCNDHRIAMAVAIASTCCGEAVVLEGSDCVKKSYPNFWEDFKSLGGIIDEWNVGE